MNWVIKINGLQREYTVGDSVIQALNGVSLNIQKGEFVALMGPSGSGKSTLLHILGCLDHASAGDYFFEGVNINQFTENQLCELRNQRIGFIFQNFNLLPRANALENVGLPVLYSPDPDQWQNLAAQALVRVGLKKRFYHHPMQLSGGERQRVAIARALVTRPALILADEPTGNLDSARGIEIMSLLTDLVKEGHTLLMVTHDATTAAYAHRIILMKDGRIVEERRNIQRQENGPCG